MNPEDELRSFIFITSEGATFQPNSDSAQPDVENMQVLGFANGVDEQHAFSSLLSENPWILESSFASATCIELKESRYENHSAHFAIKHNQVLE